MSVDTHSLDKIQKNSINYSYPNSRKVKVKGTIHPSLSVSMREIFLEKNLEEGSDKGFLVYDSSGPFSDCSVEVDVLKGIPEIRRPWIEKRLDTKVVKKVGERVIRKAEPGKNVSQLFYARRGIITPEMEYIAIRENIIRNDQKGQEGLDLEREDKHRVYLYRIRNKEID